MKSKTQGKQDERMQKKAMAMRTRLVLRLQIKEAVDGNVSTFGILIFYRVAGWLGVGACVSESEKERREMD